MVGPAHVSSLDALQDFYAGLGQFRADGLDAITALALDVRRAFDWLAEQKKSWDRAVRESEDAVTEAKAALARKQLVAPGDRKPDTTYEEKELQKAKNRLQYAEEKAERTRRWEPLLQRAVEEYDGPIRQLANRLEIDLPRAMALVKRMIGSLENYLNQATAPAPPP